MCCCQSVPYEVCLWVYLYAYKQAWPECTVKLIWFDHVSTFQNDTQATPQISRRKLNRFLSFKNLFNFLLLAFCGYIFRAIFEGLSVMSGNRRCFHKFFLYLNLRFEIIIVCWFWFTTVFYILHYCFWYFLSKLIKKSF